MTTNQNPATAPELPKNAAETPAISGAVKTRLSSVATAIRLLKAFSDSDREIGISALSKKLGVSKSTVHRVATTLVAEGLLEQNPENDRYRLGLALFSLGTLVRRRMDISNEAKPFLSKLRETTKENIHLAVLQGSEVVYVYDMESSQAVRLKPHLGSTKPLFCSAEGLAILAFQPPSFVDRVLSGPLQPRTNNTMTDPAKIRARLEKIRADGYALEDEESEIGMRCVAAPIFDAEGHAVAAVGVAGPSQRLSTHAVANFAPQVRDAAASASMRLGYRIGARSYA